MDAKRKYARLLKKNGTSNWIDGVQVPFFVQQEDLDKLKSFQLYPDDVWVVSYPNVAPLGHSK